MTTHTLRTASAKVAAITRQDIAFICGQIRTWLSSGMIPVLETRGSGVGTLRRYDDAAVFVAAALVGLSQLGMRGKDLKAKARVLKSAWDHHRPADCPLYMSGNVPGSRALILRELVLSPVVDIASPGGAGYIVDLQGLAKLIVETG